MVSLLFNQTTNSVRITPILSLSAQRTKRLLSQSQLQLTLISDRLQQWVGCLLQSRLLPNRVKRWKSPLKINVSCRKNPWEDSVFTQKIFPKKWLTRPTLQIYHQKISMPAQYAKTDSSWRLRHWVATCLRVTLIKALNSLRSRRRGKRGRVWESYSSVQRLCIERLILFIHRFKEAS